MRKDQDEKQKSRYISATAGAVIGEQFERNKYPFSPKLYLTEIVTVSIANAKWSYNKKSLMICVKVTEYISILKLQNCYLLNSEVLCESSNCAMKQRHKSIFVILSNNILAINKTGLINYYNISQCCSNIAEISQKYFYYEFFRIFIIAIHTM